MHSGETCCCLTAYTSANGSCTGLAARQHQPHFNGAKATGTKAAVLGRLDPSDYFLRFWRKRNKLLNTAKWMRTRCQLTACTSQAEPVHRGGGDVNKDMADYSQLICIICFCILRFPSGVCYWMTVLALGRSQNGPAGRTEWLFCSPRVHLRVIILPAKKKKNQNNPLYQGLTVFCLAQF